MTNFENQTLSQALRQGALDISNTPISKLITKHAEVSPYKIAITDKIKSYTYLELDEKVNTASTQLVKAIGYGGDKESKVIGVNIDRCAELIALVLAIWRTGHVYLPLDTKLPAGRVEYMLQAAKASLIICKDGSESINNKTKIITIEEVFSTIPSNIKTKDVCQADDLAYVLFTSGSTGQPKGVLVEHIGANNNIYNKIHDFEINADSAMLQNASISFDVSIWQMMIALVAGAKTVIAPEEVIYSPNKFIKFIQRQRISHLEVVPSYLSLLMDEIRQSNDNLDNLKCLVLTGENVNESNIKILRAKFPHLTIANAYGPTEASDDITHFILKPGMEMPDIMPIGYCLQNFDIYICDDELCPVPVGEAGEIVVTGIGIARGYVNPPEEGKIAFQTNLFPDRYKNRLYRTGDIGSMKEDGCIYYLGRKDRQIKLHGNRIELDEIERAIKRLEICSECAVVAILENGRPSSIRAILAKTSTENIVDIRTELLKSLPNYMIPSKFSFVESLPVLLSGKIDYNAITLNAKPPEAGPSIEVDDIACDPILEIFREILGAPDLSYDDNYFDYGGDSFKAIRISALVGPPMDVGDIYASDTIGKIIKAVKGRPPEIQSSLVDLSRNTVFPKAYVVAFPNSGGDPVAFVELAKCLYNLEPDIKVLGVKLSRPDVLTPGESLAATFELASDLADQIEYHGNHPVVVFGQCNGSAGAIALAAELAARGLDNYEVIISGALLRQNRTYPDERSDAEIVKFIRGIGANIPSSPEEEIFFLEDFRYDVYTAACFYNYLKDQKSTIDIGCGLTCVAGDTDPLVKEAPTRYKEWSSIANEVYFRPIQDCGHFPLRDKPNELAFIVREVILRLKEKFNDAH